MQSRKKLNKSKYLIIILALVITLSISLGYSYAYFNKSIVGSNIEFKTGSISFSLDSTSLNDKYQITVNASSETIVDVNINSLNYIVSKYQMYYTADDATDLIVGYSSNSTHLPSGRINANETKTVSLVIKNNSTSSKTLTIGIEGGLDKYTVDDILLKDGQNKITEKINLADITLASVLIDGKESQSLPKSGTYKLSGYTCEKNSKIEWDTYKKSIIFDKGTLTGENCSLEFTTSTDYQLLIDKVKQGDYIAYEGNNGCKKNNSTTANISTSGKSVNENANSCLGYNANSNSDGSKDSTNGMYGYCYDESYKYYVSGWRVAYTKDNRVYLISAASPECTTRTSSTANKTYISNANKDAKKYCNASYVDSCTSDDDVHAINDTDYNLITSQISNTNGGYMYTQISGATQCARGLSMELCGYNNDLLDNGGYYWFAAAYSSSSAYGIGWNPGNRDVDYNSKTYSYGLRPVIRLSSNIYVTGGSGTMDDPYTIAKNNN